MASTTDIKVGINADGVPPNIRLGIMTWNMGNASPGDEWVNTAFPNRGQDFDVIAIGMQESTFSMTTLKDVHKGDEQVAAGSPPVPAAKAASPGPAVDSGKRPESVRRISIFKGGGIQEALAPCVGAVRDSIEQSLPDFQVVEHCRRVQMQLYVLVRKSLFPHVSNVKSAAENTGLFSIFPNKGGVLVAFDLHGTKLAFMSTHLTAHEGANHCEMRNSSIKEILAGAAVRCHDDRFDVSSTSHHMFWMGDMNYRLTNDPTVPKASKNNEEMNEKKLAELQKFKDEYDAQEQELEAQDEKEKEDGKDGKDGKKSSGKDTKKAAINQFKQEVIKLVLANDWPGLLAFDELNREIKDNRALKGFTALQPSFPPTFKRKRHIGVIDEKNIADGISGEDAVEEHFWELWDHKRVPSYTDRILHRSMPHFERNLSLQSFRSFENLTTSDHKPVRAAFNVALTHGTKDILVPATVQDHLDNNAVSKIIREKCGFELTISNMRGTDLAEMDVEIGFGLGGGSDPYIVVTSDPPQLIATKKPMRSTTITHNVNPVWPADETIRVPVLTNDLEGVSRNGHLLLSVWDYDMSNADDLIGVCRIPFDVVIKAFKEGKKYRFSENVYDNGEIQGKISGEIGITGRYSKLQKEFDDNKKSAVKLSSITVPDHNGILGCCSLA